VSQRRDSAQPHFDREFLMDGEEYEVGQYFLRFTGDLYLLEIYAESVTRARVHDKRGKKITWV
jgi:hypothetical protein